VPYVQPPVRVLPETVPLKCEVPLSLPVTWLAFWVTVYVLFPVTAQEPVQLYDCADTDSLAPSRPSDARRDKQRRHDRDGPAKQRRLRYEPHHTTSARDLSEMLPSPSLSVKRPAKATPGTAAVENPVDVRLINRRQRGLTPRKRAARGRAR